jgi:hypothetical protein
MIEGLRGPSDPTKHLVLPQLSVVRPEVLDQRNRHIEPLIRAALVLEGPKRQLLGRHKFFQAVKASSPFPKDRLQHQTLRLQGLYMPQELECPTVVNDHNVAAAKEVIPPVAELLLRDGGVKVRSRKPHMLKCGVGKWLLLP